MPTPFAMEGRRGSRSALAMTTRPRSFATARSARCPWTCAEHRLADPGQPIPGYVTVRIGLRFEKPHLASVIARYQWRATRALLGEDAMRHVSSTTVITLLIVTVAARVPALPAQATSIRVLPVIGSAPETGLVGGATAL